VARVMYPSRPAPATQAWPKNEATARGPFPQQHKNSSIMEKPRRKGATAGGASPGRRQAEPSTHITAGSVQKSKLSPFGNPLARTKCDARRLHLPRGPVLLREVLPGWPHRGVPWWRQPRIGRGHGAGVVRPGSGGRGWSQRPTRVRCSRRAGAGGLLRGDGAGVPRRALVRGARVCDGRAWVQVRASELVLPSLPRRGVHSRPALAPVVLPACVACACDGVVVRGGWVGGGGGGSCVAVGVAPADFNCDTQPGFLQGSWALRAGKRYGLSPGAATGPAPRTAGLARWCSEYGAAFGEGDVVGCGLCLHSGDLFWTKNGVHLGASAAPWTAHGSACARRRMETHARTCMCA
jgi:hypothetical protein